MKKTIAILGCGWLGLPLARQLLAEGYGVKGSTTSSEKRFLLSQQGIQAYQLLMNPAPLGDLKELLQADTLVINVPPKAGKHGPDFHPEQMQYVAEAIRHSPLQHVIYVSSTSVYPEVNRVVYEEDVTEPA